MPTFNETNVRHLLRRTEFADRPARVAHLLTLGSIDAAVDDVMNIDGNPPSASFSGIPADEHWQKGTRLNEHWMNQMVTVTRSFGERMAFFWHGHICSDLGKVDNGEAMREQIDLFRTDGLGTAGASGNVADLATTMSTQVAMLRYLDNNENFADSPNQNFARELMELFLLGVGNYTEDDVEAATAAWTGHTAEWPDYTYFFDESRHESASQQFLGRTINGGGRPAAEAGDETIEVILGTGPLGAGTVSVGANNGRSSAAVAAEFLSKKLWQELGEANSGGVPPGVLGAMSAALLDNDFDIRPWVRAMLIHDDFYATDTKTGLIRQPVEYVVAVLIAMGLGADSGGQHWLMEPCGQALLYPPNVSGWKPNGYWVNASAMGGRQRIAQEAMWALFDSIWSDSDNGYVDLPGGRLDKPWLYNPDLSSAAAVDGLIALTNLESTISASTRQAIIDHLDAPEIDWWMRRDALLLLLSAPDLHVA